MGMFDISASAVETPKPERNTVVVAEVLHQIFETSGRAAAGRGRGGRRRGATYAELDRRANRLARHLRAQA